MKADMPTVAVLMSTYNGEKYIREQIDSILRQKDVDILLLIRDDGSTDHTREIISEYVFRYCNISAYEGENIGVGKSFMNLLHNAPNADYYSFADQDDVWLEDKLIRAIEVIRKTVKIGKNKAKDPVLYVSNLTLVDNKLNVYDVRFRQKPVHNLYSEIHRNELCGCTMVMNQALRDTILCENHIPSEKVLKMKNHDGWYMIVANIVGTIVYDDSSRILYRQHENNLVGVKRLTLMGKVRNKYRKFITKESKGSRSALANEILSKFYDELDEDLINNLKLLSNANSIENIKRIRKDCELKLALPESEPILCLKAMCNWL